MRADARRGRVRPGAEPRDAASAADRRPRGVRLGLHGHLHRAKAKAIASFSYWQSGLLTPMFLVAGTFFPLTGLPRWAQVLGNFNPLFHCVQLVRHAVFGFHGWADAGHLAFLVAFAMVTWRLAVRFMERRLIL